MILLCDNHINVYITIYSFSKLFPSLVEDTDDADQDEENVDADGVKAVNTVEAPTSTSNASSGM
jgi:hypothetical protein